jgi:hypothetical protein
MPVYLIPESERSRDIEMGSQKKTERWGYNIIKDICRTKILYDFANSL